MVLLNNLTTHMILDDPEERRILTQVSWVQYEALLSDGGDRSAYRVYFLDGVLEILAPSRKHERGKTQLSTTAQLKTKLKALCRPRSGRHRALRVLYLIVTTYLVVYQMNFA